MKTLLRNINIIKNNEISYGYDILINGDKIENIGKNIIVSDTKSINCDNFFVRSGFVNCCFDESCNIKNQAINGVTTVVCLNNDLNKALLLKEMGFTVYFGIGVFNDAEYVNFQILQEKYINLLKNDIKCVLFAKNSFTTDENVFSDLVKFSKEFDLPILTVTNETLYEVGECDKVNGFTPVRLLEEYGVLDRPHMLLGCENCDKDDVEIMQYHDTYVCVTPTKSLRLGNGVAPVYSMIKNGVGVCLGGDNFLKEISLVSDLQSGVLNESGLVSNLDLDNITSINPNKLLKQNAGEIGIGNHADLVVLDTPSILDLNTSNVLYTIANGKVIYKKQ